MANFFENVGQPWMWWCYHRKNWVVTAAHCVEDFEAGDFEVAAGFLEQSDDSAAQTTGVSRVYKNRNYPGDVLFMTSDIALLKLKKPFEFNDEVQPIKMAAKGDNFQGNTCVLTGWGRYDRATQDLSDTLQQLETTCISREACQNGFKRFGWKIKDSHICFKVKGATACHGDSGGPAVCKKDGEWVLVGVTSGGSPQCNKGMPNIYTRISEFRA